ncbi:hypothetical protein BJ684DRAFT_21601 [Piptocephalis cylindrospora]|uniref:Uncharacterized protein n=1 Tax=Piptocephalis cylindrospora TaxID=1907219 RepID=A0A4P9XZL5_9FUNG|nr:hypothetical protein BJ684DRAFT_21601 [Piptocephalis cylindrospora]|eukprot:RKP11824.1 hypothetical protein BJ684DRAFT_21601 [Piptocephalis cylindrospora]
MPGTPAFLQCLNNFELQRTHPSWESSVGLDMGALIWRTIGPQKVQCITKVMTDACPKLRIGITKAPRLQEWWLTSELGECVFNAGQVNAVNFLREGQDITYIQAYQMDKEAVSGKSKPWMAKLDWKDMHWSNPPFQEAHGILTQDFGGFLPKCQEIMRTPSIYFQAFSSLTAAHFQAANLWLIMDGQEASSLSPSVSPLFALVITDDSEAAITTPEEAAASVIALLQQGMIEATIGFQTGDSIFSWSLEQVRRAIPRRLEKAIRNRRSQNTWRKLFIYLFPSYNNATDNYFKPGRWTRIRCMDRYCNDDIITVKFRKRVPLILIYRGTPNTGPVPLID